MAATGPVFLDAALGAAMTWLHPSAWLMRTAGELEGGAAAHWLSAGFAVLTAIGLIGSFRTVGR
jgi:hypothetical protein